MESDPLALPTLAYFEPAKVMTLSDDEIKQQGKILVRAASKDANSADAGVRHKTRNKAAMVLLTGTCGALALATADKKDTTKWWSGGGTVLGIASTFVASTSDSTEFNKAFAKKVRAVIGKWKADEARKTGKALQAAFGDFYQSVEKACGDYGNCKNWDRAQEEIGKK